MGLSLLCNDAVMTALHETEKQNQIINLKKRKRGKSMKMKEKYEAPFTKFKQVELENGFMKASVIDKEPNTDNPVTAGSQEIGGSFDFSDDDPWGDN